MNISPQNFNQICAAAPVTKRGGAEKTGRFSGGELEKRNSMALMVLKITTRKKISSLGKRLYCTVKKCVRKV